jgi:hypothetical protein
LTWKLIVYTVRPVEFLFDRAKDLLNRKKHGVSLGRTVDFDFEAALFVIDDREAYGEVRIRAIGFLDARLHALVFTQDGENIRAISLRKATRHEEDEYEQSR